MTEKSNFQRVCETGMTPCDDVYIEEFNQGINTLKRFREAWLRYSSFDGSDLFQYADSDFYFYRFTIDRLERSVEPLLTDILLRVMKRYKLSFEVPDDFKKAPFVFILNDNNRKIGIRFKDFYYEEDVNRILKDYNVDEATIIRICDDCKGEKSISRENDNYKNDGLKLRSISIESFFKKYFGEDEYNSFVLHLNDYLKETREITGYQSIKFLSSMNLAMRRIFEEKILTEWDYRNYSFETIDSSSNQLEKYMYLSNTPLPLPVLEKIENNYLSGELYKSMLGTNDYAESFITSEWLYHSLKGKQNFDFTSVISGYLKSIEQLLYRIVMLNVDNNCKISMSKEKSITNAAKNNNVSTYKLGKNHQWIEVPADESGNGFKYIDLTQDQIQYMDSSIGTFEYFLKNNPHIFVDQEYSSNITDMVCCFRKECRNGFFHTHNLKDWSIVEKTRSNAIYLYFVLLGGCIIAIDKIKELGILSEDSFDELCKKIRGLRHNSVYYIFEYIDGKKRKMVYDFLNNTMEFTDGRVEHYESLLFYEVEDFSNALEKLDEGIREEQKVYISRDNLPVRIYVVYRDNRLEALEF